MLTTQNYVPALKTRQGEFDAIKNAAADVLECMVPLFDVPPVDWDFINDRPSRSAHEHVGRLGKLIGDALGPERPFFIDSCLVLPDDETRDHPTAVLLETLAAANLNFIPVWNVFLEPEPISVIRSFAKSGRGACLRFGFSDFDVVDDLPALFESTLNEVDLAPSEVDLVLDLRATSANTQPPASLSRMAFNLLPSLPEWRSFVLLATSFPPDLSGFNRGFSHSDRIEWRAWNELFEQRDRISRMPTFGDYGIAHPDHRPVDPRLIQMSAQIRYTTDDQFLIAKGRSVRRDGFEQQYDLANALVKRPEFHGDQFSFGDSTIARWAKRQGGPGNATTWRTVGTSQHLAFVSDQLANLHGL